ncbi:AbrB family transcriptional regulator [Novispirillum sp. DQ9]|uniref:AbrB family transcriptional regulator n=1 Tax=Novispirillum sp. DQ9 TaxID=3398612 RepID=UPI003C7C1A3C
MTAAESPLPPSLPPALSRESLRRLALALALGTAGGAVFWGLRLPLPWMLGAVLTVSVAALSGLRPAVPQGLRSGMLAILGVMLGSAFTPGLIDRLGPWLPSLAVLLVVSVVTPWIAGAVFRRFGGFDRVTAYFAGTPGGINEMVMVGTALGGDERTIALVHALRIMIVVFIVAAWFRLVEGAAAGQGAASAPWLMDGAFGPADLAWLAAAAVVGRPVGRLLRLPAPQLTGPMVLAAVIHLMGLTELQPPAELIAVAQVVVGSALGARFVGAAPLRLIRTAVLAAGSSLVMLGLAALAAWGLASVTGLPFLLLLLAYVPGGLAEMSLIGLALGMDVPFVATHHVVRIALVIAVAPLLFRLTGKTE